MQAQLKEEMKAALEAEEQPLQPESPGGGGGGGEAPKTSGEVQARLEQLEGLAAERLAELEAAEEEKYMMSSDLEVLQKRILTLTLTLTSEANPNPNPLPGVARGAGGRQRAPEALLRGPDEQGAAAARDARELRRAADRGMLPSYHPPMLRRTADRGADRTVLPSYHSRVDTAALTCSLLTPTLTPTLTPNLTPNPTPTLTLTPTPTPTLPLTRWRSSSTSRSYRRLVTIRWRRSWGATMHTVRSRRCRHARYLVITPKLLAAGTLPSYHPIPTVGSTRCRLLPTPCGLGQRPDPNPNQPNPSPNPTPTPTPGCGQGQGPRAGQATTGVGEGDQPGALPRYHHRLWLLLTVTRESDQ
eukprot:scaffold99978_cov36-Phaeocystis_antarctica.AAC.1